MTIVESVGWVLVHFVWQGTAIALVLAALLALTSTAQATLRYALACAALTVMLMATVATAVTVITSAEPTMAKQPSADDAAATSPLRASSDEVAATTSSALQTVGKTFNAQQTPSPGSSAVRAIVVVAMPWVVAIWAVGVLFLSVRLVGGWWRTLVLRRVGIAPVPESCLTQLANLSSRLGITRPVTMVASLRVAVPIVLGHLKPVIVLPAAVVAGMNASQLEAIVAHELAHVRRHDYLVNLAQTVVETLLFYHPAVWWVSRQVRETREHCCDDLAVTICSSRAAYVHALLGLEELRGDDFSTSAGALALGATGGSLLSRARRLLLQTEVQPGSPLLAAGVIALTVVAVAGASASFAPEELAMREAPVLEEVNLPASNDSEPRAAVQQSGVQDVPASSVVVSADVTGPLGARWAEAERAAREARRTRYWIGYSISPVRTLPAVVYSDRSSVVFGDSIELRGHLVSSDSDGLRFPGRRLAVPAADRSIKLLFAFDTRRGTPALTAVHVSNMTLPVDTKDLPVYWLGSAEAGQSIEHLDHLYGRASTQDIQHDIIVAVSLHEASDAVVAWLERRVASGDADALRAEAAEGIAWHPLSRSVTVLDRTARTDRAGRVRQEAAEALGDLAMPEAATALVALARSQQDTPTRLEAVEALGARSETEALDALGVIARQDPVVEIQREAVETLGDLSDARGVPLLLDLARTHPDTEVRREAIETLGDTDPTENLVRLLRGFALEDADAAVQVEAVETLADLPHAAGLATLLELVQSHPRPAARREAVEALGQLASDDGKDLATIDRQKILDLLSTLAKTDRDVEVQVEAAETLGDISGREAIERLEDLAKTHPDERIRAEAVESLGDTGATSALATILKGIALSDKSPHVQDEAIETLEGLADGAGITALIELAREHPDDRARKQALEALLDSDHPRAREVFQRALQKPSGR